MIMTNDVRSGAATVLLVEDDLSVAGAVRDVLEYDGYTVVHAETGEDARAQVAQSHPDLIVLDLMLPDVDGLVLVSGLKALTNAPILISSATQNRKRDAVLGLKLGADDFISKPFDIYEFEARIEALLRRRRATKTSPRSVSAAPAANQGGAIQVGALTIDRTHRAATLGEMPLQLTATEYRLLSAMASRPDEILSREELAQLVWGYQDVSSGRTIDVHIRRLRMKLAAGPVAAPPITSVRGFGYMVQSPRTRTDTSPASAAA